MIIKPLPQSYWVHEGLLCAGQFPGAADIAGRDEKLRGLIECGIKQVINLMEEQETNYDGRPFTPYVARLQELAEERGHMVDCHRVSIKDAGIPSRSTMTQILDRIDSALKAGTPTYLHCWGGHGRTGTVVACHLVRRGHAPRAAIDAVCSLRRGLPKNHRPFEGAQEEFILAWTAND